MDQNKEPPDKLTHTWPNDNRRGSKMTPWERIVSSTVNRMKRQHTEWEGIFALLYLKKVLYTKHTRTTTTQLQKEKKKDY